jgi:antitoxin (DNA-binding transcriptional repressor) of toxin-antitoxin stability system
MATVAIEDAAKRLNELVRESQPGEEIILTADDQPVAKLVALLPPRKAGSAAHRPHFMADDFDAIPEGFGEYLP